ncbi:MAG: hypothetical protein F4Y16_02465 [Holophagales bacterium]|nr:hypothetical protein [Holophagales bacterium]MYH26657.1 hypothetical protein [Holophagales bacterium]
MTGAAREHLEGRDKWQDEAALRGLGAETQFHEVLSRHLSTRGVGVTLAPRPGDLRGIYGVHASGRPHGIRPDAAIYGPKKRAIYVEMKRQRAAGNAHERACKYFTPGILRSGRKIAKQPEEVIPFWWIFTNGIAEDDRYVREITHWFEGAERHVLLWQPRSSALLISHFERNILPLLI